MFRSKAWKAPAIGSTTRWHLAHSEASRVGLAKVEPAAGEAMRRWPFVAPLERPEVYRFVAGEGE